MKSPGALSRIGLTAQKPEPMSVERVVVANRRVRAWGHRYRCISDHLCIRRQDSLIRYCECIDGACISDNDRLRVLRVSIASTSVDDRVQQAIRVGGRCVSRCIQVADGRRILATYGRKVDRRSRVHWDHDDRCIDESNWCIGNDGWSHRRWQLVHRRW